MLELEKEIQTRAGRQVKILMEDGGGSFPLLGVWMNEQQVWVPCSWSADGYSADDDLDKRLMNRGATEPLAQSPAPVSFNDLNQYNIQFHNIEDSLALAVIICNNPEVTNPLLEVLKELQYGALIAPDNRTAYQAAGLENIQVVIPDLDIQDKDLPGNKQIEFLKSTFPGAEIIVAVTDATIERATEVIPCGIFDYILKPHGKVTRESMVHLFKMSIERLIEKHGLKSEKKQALQSLETAHAELEERVVARTRELNRVNKELWRKSHYDTLTGLANRSLLAENLKLEISHAKRNKTGLAIFFIDLDGFKAINDTQGHDVGDWLLREVSERLQEVLRDSDTIARQGGDEFIIICPEIDNQLGPAVIAEKIQESMQESFTFKNEELHIGTSIGIAVYPDHSQDSDELLKMADMAMYYVKENGKQSYKFYTEALNENAEQRIKMLDSLQRAVRDEEFELYYQPRMELKTNRITSLEALIRWSSPEGVISPGDFIPLAEETNLISNIGKWVLVEACRQLVDFKKLGLTDLLMAINVSPRQFKLPELPRTLEQTLRATGLDPKDIEIEITEGAAMQNMEFSEELLIFLSEKGINISIDDFGTGYSSLSYLKQFPIHTLKIDRTFIKDIPHNPDSCDIVRAIIAMAHCLELVVVAEGVEEEDQLEFLRENDCDEIQGFIICRPLPAHEILELLQMSNLLSIPS